MCFAPAPPGGTNDLNHPINRLNQCDNIVPKKNWRPSQRSCTTRQLEMLLLLTSRGSSNLLWCLWYRLWTLSGSSSVHQSFFHPWKLAIIRSLFLNRWITSKNSPESSVLSPLFTAFCQDWCILAFNQFGSGPKQSEANTCQRGWQLPTWEEQCTIFVTS